MRRVVLALSFALALLAVPAIAQIDEGTTAPNFTATGETEVQETRTNPDAGMIGPGGGLTITGTVVSWNDDEIVIRTTTGIEHIVIQQDTSRPSTFTEGQVVSIDYLRSTQNGVMIARQIRPGEAPLVGQSTVDVEGPVEREVEAAMSDLGEAADDVGAALSEIDDRVEARIESALDTNIDNDSTIAGRPVSSFDSDTSLPATAGSSPLVALFGLLALGAAAGLRRLF
jgi:MYXO-CTERM domain-containing protein